MEQKAAVAILPATLLINGVCTIDNVPNISDVKIYCNILEGNWVLKLHGQEKTKYK